MTKKTLPASHKRLIALMVSFSVFYFLLVGRLWQVTVIHEWQNETDILRAKLSKARASFIDRRGILLATNVKTFSVYANPYLISHKPDSAQKLQRLFPHLSYETLHKRLSHSKRFVWIARHVTPAEREAILSLGIPGVFLMEDQRRIWPHSSLCSHILGFTSVDQIGISGLEKGLNELAHNRKAPIQLSLDIRIQHIVRDELARTIHLFQAEAGNALLIKIDTGEIIASVSLPDFNPHLPHKASPKALFNRNTTGVYEFGSLLKIHNTAMLLDSGLATFHSMFDASVPLQLGKFRITDFKGKNRPLSMREAFLFSSNIANAKMALRAGISHQKAFLKKMGFWEPISLEIPEKAMSLMPKNWRESTLITASYGYGFAITPLHMVQSLSTIVTGSKRPLTLLLQDTPCQGEACLKPQTVSQMRLLLHEATINGQATRASVERYAVGAKTGTCNLRNARGRYVEKQNMTSCAGVFPIHKPEYVLLVTVERPKPNHLSHGFATAGWIAAPLFSKIVERAAPLLGILPEAFKEHPLEHTHSLPLPQTSRLPLVLTLDSLLQAEEQ